MTIIDKIVKGDTAPKNTEVLWLNTEDNIIYVFNDGWVKTSAGSVTSVYTGTEAERLAIKDPFNGLEFHQVDGSGNVTRYLYDANVWTVIIDPSVWIDIAEQDHNRAVDDHNTAGGDHTRATQDHGLAVEDHQNAIDDHAQYLVDHESIAHKANVDGYYGQMTVGAAENLVGDSEETYTFTTQMTGGDVEFGSGAGQLTKVQGNGIAWNQLIQNGDFSDGTTGWGAAGDVTLSATNNVLSVATATNGDKYAFRIPAFVANHVYYTRFDVKSPNAGERICFVYYGTGGNYFFRIQNEANVWERKNAIFKAVEGTINSYRLFNGIGGTVNQYKNIICLDLSLIFGLGNEPATVDAAEAALAALVPQKPYYQHNAGELFGTKILHLISYGQNLLNPANGQARLAPYDYESVVNKYGIAAKAGVTLGTITFTPDATGEAEIITPDSNGQFTISGAGTLSVAVSAGSLADVYVWAVYDGAKDGIDNYVSFQQDAVEIKASEVYGKLNGIGEYVKVFADGVMRGAGSVHDLIDLQSMTADVNIAPISLKGQSWYYAGDGVFRNVRPSNGKAGNSFQLGTKPNIVSNCYAISPVCYASDAKNYDRSITLHYNATCEIFLVDSRYSTKEALNGALSSNDVVWYELATPLHYTDLKLSSDGGETFRDLPTTIVVDNWGVWQQKPSEGLTPVIGHDFEGIAATISTILPMDAVEILKSVQDNGIMTSDQRAQLTNILTALQTAGIIGSFTIAETPTNKAFSINIEAPTPEPEPEP